MILPRRIRPKVSREVTFFGKRFILAHGIVSGFIEMISEIVIANQYQVELIKNNATVIDAGANIGIFSIVAAVKHPDATIYAFEPTPDTFSVLRENTKGYQNIKVFNLGLGDVSCSKRIALIDSPEGNYIADEGIPVELVTIDSFNIKADFMKIDTEGYESNVLKGAAETINKCKPVIAMSAYHKPNDKRDLPALLKSIDPTYVCELRHDSEEVFICQSIHSTA